MSRDATLELLRATRNALIADATLADFVSTRVATDWGSDLASPYMRLSVPQVKQWEDDQGDGSEYTLRVHVFVKEPAPVVCSQIAAQVREVLQDADLGVPGADLWWLTYDQTLNQQDPADPTLRMAVVAFKAVTTSP